MAIGREDQEQDQDMSEHLLRMRGESLKNTPL